jgi:hypothetical protein
MESTRMLTILVLVFASVVNGSQYLTVNNQNVASITLEAGQSCTIEVVSDNSDSYVNYVGFDNGIVLGNFLHLETKPEAGDLAEVTEYSVPTFYGYCIVAAGMAPPPSPGVHFVFQYEARQFGETDVKLYNETFTSVVNSVHITVIPSSMGTAFTYQGRLMDGNTPADGLYDLQFKLYNHPTGGTQQDGTIDINSLDIIDGYFTVELDFGVVFDGGARWLEIGVRPGASPVHERYTILSPRQELAPTPYALYAKTAGGDNDWMVSGNDMYSIPSGNVGIGMAYPSQKLEVAGTTKSNRFRTTLNSGAVGLEMDLTATPGGGCAPFAIWDARNGGANYLFGIRQEMDNLVFRRYTDYWEGSLGIMTLEASTGNVGIRTGSHRVHG